MRRRTDVHDRAEEAEQRRQCCEKKIVEREQMRFWLIFWLKMEDNFGFLYRKNCGAYT